MGATTTTRRQLLAYWTCVAVAIGAGIALRAEAVDGVLLADDYDHYAMHAGIYPVPRHPLDMFAFVKGDGDERQRLMDAGRLPWWSDPDLHLSVLRPLSSALLYLDFELGGARGKHFHLQGFAWWALLVIGVAVLLREVLPLPVAAIATSLYALEEAHALPLAWTANRNALVAVSLAVWSLWAHVRARRGGGLAVHVGASALMALALAGGEHALGMLGYFIAFELFAARGRLAARLLALAPIAAVVTLYLVLRSLLGHGIAGSGFYISPFSTPLAFLEAASWRLPLLLGDVTLGLAADWYYMGPPWLDEVMSWGFLPSELLAVPRLQVAQRSAGVASGLLLIALSLWRARVLPASLAGACVWLVPGALLSLIPSSATLPMSRLLLAASIGVSVAFASLGWMALRSAWAPGPWPRRLAAGTAVAAIVAVHGVAAARRSHKDVAYYTARSLLERAWTLTAEVNDGLVGGQRLFVIAAQEWSSQWALPFVFHANGRRMPRSCHLLSGGMVNGHVLQRPAEDVLELSVIGMQPRGTFLDSVYRPEGRHFHEGERVALEPFDVEVLEAWHGQPRRVRFTFHERLDPAMHVLLYPQTHGLRRVPLPAVGGAVQLGAPAPPRVVERAP